MARTPHPWYRAERDEWRVTVRGTDHCLGKHPHGFPPPRRQRNKWNAPPPILEAFHRLMAAAPAAPLPNPPPDPADPAQKSVAEVFKKFLDWCEKNRAPRTHEWTRNHLRSFVASMESRADRIDLHTFPAACVRPFHVTEWVDAKPRWGANHKRGAIIAVQRAFSWAAKAGHIEASPVRGIEKPPPKRREQVLTRGEFDTLLGNVSDQPFRDVLEFCWETGCRVQEVRLLEAAHYKPDRGRFELPPQKAKGKKRWRLIYLTPRATEIAVRLALAHPEGPVFRNEGGRPWDAQNFNNRFCRIQHRLGRVQLGEIVLDEKKVKALADTLPKLKTVAGAKVPKTEKELLREARKKLSGMAAAKAGTKYALTAIRHSFATRLLEAGVDNLTVSALLGHADGSLVLSRTYSHIGEKSDFLREELLRVSAAGTAA